MFIHANWDVKIEKKEKGSKYIFVKNTLQIIFLSSSALQWDVGGMSPRAGFSPQLWDYTAPPLLTVK